jgi:hypothetical protein
MPRGWGSRHDRPPGVTHRPNRPGGEPERAVEDLGQLVATVLAAGLDEARRTLEATPAVTVKRMLLDEAIVMARVLLVEAGGDKVRAY